MSRMALRRAAFNSFCEPRPFAPTGPFVAGSASSGWLHSGQRLAKPGLPGLSSNSSPQATQTLIGNGMTELFYRFLTSGKTAAPGANPVLLARLMRGFPGLRHAPAWEPGGGKIRQCRVLRDVIPPTPPGPEGSNGNGLMRVQWVTRYIFVFSSFLMH